MKIVDRIVEIVEILVSGKESESRKLELATELETIGLTAAFFDGHEGIEKLRNAVMSSVSNIEPEKAQHFLFEQWNEVVAC